MPPAFLTHVLRGPDDDAGGGADPGPQNEDSSPTTSEDPGISPQTDGDAEPSHEEAVLATLGIKDDAEPEPSAAEPEQPADGDPGPGKPGEAAAAADVTGKAAPAPADPDEDLLKPLPENVKAETRERFDKLAGTYRELRDKAQRSDENLRALTDVIRDTGATNEEFASSIEYMQAIHSDNPQELERARAMVVAELRGIDRRLGRPPDDPQETDALLARHPDLAQFVESMDMTQEVAQRYAAEREAAQERTQAQLERTAHQRQLEEHEAAVTAGAQKVAQLEAQFRARDPNYARIEAAMSSRAAEIARLYPPEQWHGAVGRAYQEMRALIGDPPASTTPGPQPLRPGQTGSTTKPAPESMEDAVLQKLGIT